MNRITRIQAWAFRCPTPRPVATSFGIMHDRPAVFVRIEDNEGAFGWGEIWANWPAAGAEHRVRLLEMDIAHLLFATDAETPESIFADLSEKTCLRAVQCGEVGPFGQVIAGLDIALWDMAARRANLPLRQFIRPGAPDQVPAYASGIQIAAVSEMLPRAQEAEHRVFKLKVGFDETHDISEVIRLHSELGDRAALACDANQAWTLSQAQRFAAGIRDVPLEWLEEPLPVFAPVSEWQSLSQTVQIPLAGGENFDSRAAFSKAISAGHLSVIQPDVAKWGGITGCIDVAREALAAGRRYCPHFLGGGIGLIASAELLAGAGGDGLLEVDVNDNPLRTKFFDDAEPMSDGFWCLNNGPGLGIDSLPGENSAYQTLYMECSC